MNRRIVSFSLMLTFLLLALVWAASAQTRTVGVTVSNTFKYNTATSWISDDPSATPPSSLVGINSTQWVELSITAISGTNITGQTTTLYKNGTKITEGGWVDVNTGDGENLTVLIISANLAPGDSVYTSSPYNTTLIINETTSRTYQDGARDTNHINVTSASTSSQGNLSLANNIYWDKSTGVLVELSTVESNQTGTYTTKWSEDVQISDSNVWTVPEFPNWTPTLITLIMLTSAIVVIHGQKRPKKPLP